MVSANFRRLVLFCVEADLCVQILIFQHFSRSTRLAYLRTAPNSEVQQVFVDFFFGFFRKKLADFNWIFEFGEVQKDVNLVDLEKC